MSITASPFKKEEAKEATPAKNLQKMKLGAKAKAEKDAKTSTPVEIRLNGKPLAEAEKGKFKSWKQSHIKGDFTNETEKACSVPAPKSRAEDTDTHHVQLFLTQPVGKVLPREEVHLNHYGERALMHASPAQRNGIGQIDAVIKKPETFGDQETAIAHRHTLIESGAFAPKFQGCVKDQQETSEQALERWWAWKQKQTATMRATAPEFIPSRQLQNAVDGHRMPSREPGQNHFVIQSRDRNYGGAMGARNGLGPYAAPNKPFEANLGQFMKYTILKREK